MRVRRKVPKSTCGGCGVAYSGDMPACTPCFGRLPAHEVVGYFEAMRAAPFAPNVSKAARSARNRVVAILRGVRA